MSNPLDDDVHALDVDDAKVASPPITDRGVEVVTNSFGKGSTRRKMLVSSGVSLNELHRISK